MRARRGRAAREGVCVRVCAPARRGMRLAAAVFAAARLGRCRLWYQLR